MFRALGCFGLGIIFLAISGELRQTVMNILDGMQKWVLDYSPLSYVGIGVCVLLILMFCLHRAAQPRI